MKKDAFVLNIAIILLLAACGGSSDPVDPSHNSSTNNSSTPIPLPTTPTIPTNKVSGTYQGQAYIIPVNGSAGKAENIGSNSLATHSIDGQKLTTEFPNVSFNEIANFTDSKILGQSYRLFIASGKNYAHSRFGYISEGDKDYIFSHGVPTTNMPSNGIVRYVGNAALGRTAIGAVADADIVADFGQKTLRGQISQIARSRFDFSQINFNATISGNSFSGDGAVKSNGNFYGNNAAEVGGIFHDTTQNLYGSFGARRASN